MLNFFRPNVGRAGRLLRAGLGLLLVGAGGFVCASSVWAGAVLLVAGAFALFEAFRGWCLLRACGLKTRL